MKTLLFDESVVLVTGGGSGIGRTSAEAFAREGAKVVVSDIALENAEATVGFIEKAGGCAVPLATDVSDEVEVAALIRKTVEIFGRLDCAFNNAGISIECSDDWDIGMIDRTMAVNYRGVLLCMKNEIEQMLPQGHGSIVNTSSIMGLVGNSLQPGYVASKHAVIGATRQAALQYGLRGIRVNAVCPGTILTAMNGREEFGGHDAAIERAKQMNPVGRIGRSEEVAEAVLWLSSHKASFVTGQALAVDGGYTAK